jgi:hypothetical protein
MQSQKNGSLTSGISGQSGKKTVKDWNVYLIQHLEGEKLKFAKILLFGVSIIFVFGAVVQLFMPDQGGPIFESCKTLLPPLATLIIGYYFSERTK